MIQLGVSFSGRGKNSSRLLAALRRNRQWLQSKGAQTVGRSLMPASQVFVTTISVKSLGRLVLLLTLLIAMSSEASALMIVLSQVAPIRSPIGTLTETRRLDSRLNTTTITPGVALQQGQIYYVAADGDDDNPGTETQPFRTIQHAADTAREPGDTVIIRSGTYSPFRIRYPGAENQPITFRNYPGERPVIDGTLGGAKGIDIRHYSGPTVPIGWLVIDGLEISHARQEGLKGYRIHHVVIRNCSIHHSGEENILVSGSHHITFDANLVYGASEDHELYASGCYWTVTNNIFFGGGRRIMQLYPYTHDRPEEFRHIKHWKISNNTFAFNRFVTGLSLSSYYVGDIPGETRDVEICNNIFYGNAGSAIYLSTAHPDIKGVSIHHNVHYANGAFIGGGTGEGTEYVAYDNYHVDPLFIHTDQYDFGNNDFHLQPSSPAIDAGASQGAPSHDLDGNSRPRGTGYDIGAYESPFSARVTDLRVVAAIVDTPNPTLTLRWTAPAAAITYTLRYSDTLIIEANWAGAFLFTDALPGSAETYTATAPWTGGMLYFALKFQNAAGAWSALSNNAFFPHMDIYLPLVMKDYVSSSPSSYHNSRNHAGVRGGGNTIRPIMCSAVCCSKVLILKSCYPNGAIKSEETIDQLCCERNIGLSPTVRSRIRMSWSTRQLARSL